MYEDMVSSFAAAVASIGQASKAQTKEELIAQLGRISEAMQQCEKLMLYLATSTVHNEDLVTYLFEFKQLARLEKQVEETLSTLPVEKKPDRHPSWMFWQR